MKKQILLATSYNKYINVTPALWLQLQDCDLYTKEGSWSEPVYTIANDGIDTVIVDVEELVKVQEVIDINTVSAENNRLTRLVDELQAKLAALTISTTSFEIALQ